MCKNTFRAFNVVLLVLVSYEQNLYFLVIALKTPAMKKNLDKVMGKWNDMQSKSQLFVDR